GTCFLAFCQKAPALTSKRILNQSSIHFLFKKRPFDQNGFRGALLVSSSGDRRAIGVKTHIRLVRAGTDARHYEASLSRVAELVIAACRQHDLDACSLSRPS